MCTFTHFIKGRTICLLYKQNRHLFYFIFTYNQIVNT